MRFRAEQRLRRQLDFRATRERGRRMDCGGFTLWYHRRGPRDAAAIVESTSGTLAPEGPSLRPSRLREDSRSAAAEEPTTARVGVVASIAAVGGAVKRNRAKRRLREVFRRNQHRVPAEFDLLMVARTAINHLEYAEIERRFVEACERLFGGEKR